MLHKNLPNSVKDVDAGRGVVCGYASSFNVVDDGNDMVLPGAFTKTIAEQGPSARQPRIKFLYQHDATQILGVPQVLKEDGFGLYFEAKIAPTALGRDVLTLYEEGVITEHSIGYETIEADWDRTRSVRLLKTLRLFEYSAVTWGMNSETPTVAVKGLADPMHLSVIATKAAKLDSLLHNGNLHSDALCETLERELKALQTALAPSHAVASQPYDIQGVLASMNNLKTRLEGKTASDDDKKAQEARSKKYGIGIKDGGNVTKPGKYASLTDDDFADPVNYSYPIDTKAHADNAASRFGDADNRSVYTKAEQDIIDKRIAAAQKKFGENQDDSGKAANVNTRRIKGTGGDIEVSENGTHAAYTGTHTHSHKAMGSQGDDDMHAHMHTHDGDAAHSHPDDHKAKTSDTSQRRIRKARDFDTLFQSLSASDQLQDEWGDTFIAFTHAMEELMWQASSVRNGWAMPDMADGFDVMEAAQSNIDAFSKALLDLVQRSDAADFTPCLDYDGDQFLDPDGCNADEDDDDWKARTQSNPLKTMPEPPARLRKAGRAISNANRDIITKALDGMSDAMQMMKEHHGAIADLMTKTDPDAVRQDEYDTQGDDDTPNGGTNINKSRYRSNPAPDRRNSQAGTTHQGNDTSALIADLDSVVSRLKLAGKAK